MKKILDKLFFIIVIYAIGFSIADETLRYFSLYFREWVYIISAIFIILFFSIWIYYKISKLKSRKKKIILNILYTIVLIILLGNPFTLFFVALSYQPEHIVEKNNQKMIAYVSAFFETHVNYYEYKNPFIFGNRIMEEWYGEGGFDPIENKFNREYEVFSTTYYDKDGNEIRTEYHSKKENTTENNTASNITKPELPEKEEKYYMEDGKCYTNITGEKKEIIPPTEVADIADKEAQNPKYQYQSWKSEFYTRGKNKDDYISIELLIGLDEVSRLYHWTKDWAQKDSNNRLMWKVRLFDENDPLTSLYIYVDSITGEIIGAGQSSD